MNELKTLVDETIEWANNLSEQWTGTMIGDVIDSQNSHLKGLVAKDNMNLASIAVLELVQTCDHAEGVIGG